MEKSLQVTGVNIEELREAIILALMLLGNKKSMLFWGGQVVVNQEGESDSMNSELRFSSHSDIGCNNLFPVSIGVSELTSICWTWLQQFRPQECFGDGSIGSGWTLHIGHFGDDYEISLKFKTMYYGK